MFFKKSDVLAKADKYLRQKKYKLALEEFLKYLQKNPNDVNIINRVGDLYAQVGDKDKAVDFFLKSADYYYKEGFYTKSIAILRKILRIDPDNIKVYERLADLYVQDGNIAEAKRVYLEIAEKYTKQGLKKRALEIYKKMVELDPLNTVVRLKLADAFIKEGMREEAADQLISTAKKLLKMGKNDDAKQLLTAAKKLGLGDAVIDVTLAEIYVEKKEYEKAEQILDKAYARNTGNSLLLELLAFVKLKTGKLADSLKIAKRLFELDKSKYRIIETIFNELIAKNKINEAWSLIKPVIDHLVLNEEYDKAIDLLKKIVDKKQYFIPALKVLADIYDKKEDRIFNVTTLEKLVEAYKRDGNVEEARATLKKLLEYDPANIEYKEALKELKAYEISDDEISVSEEDFELDEEELVESLDLEDTTQKMLGGISEAEFYIEHGYKDKAYSMLEQILRKDPLNKKANLLLLPLCKERGERAKASQCYLNLAEISMNEGDFEKAEDYLNQSERLLPGSSGFLRRQLEKKKKEEGLVEVESFDFEPDEEEISLSDAVESFDEEELDFGIDNEVVGLHEEAITPPENDFSEAISLDEEETELELEDNISSEDLFNEDAKEGGEFVPEEQSFLDADSLLETFQPEKEEGNALEELDEAKIESVDLFEEFEDLKLEFEDSKKTTELKEELEKKVVEDEKDAKAEKPQEIVEDSVDLTDEIAEIEFYISQNLFEEAEELLNNLVVAHPNHKDVLALKEKFESLKGQAETEQLVAEKSGDFEELLEEEFIDLKSQLGEDLDIFQDNTELTDSAPQEEVKSLDELFKEFKKGVEEQIDQEDFETHYNLGIAYKEMGLYNEAIEEFIKASHDPNRLLDCSFMIAGVYSELGEYKKAIEWLESGLEHAQKTGADDRPILYELATLCEKNGDKEKAKSYYAMIYEKDPNYRDVASKLK
ncbi:hypothetical protein TTHT_1705 [Thermotomaculum hydrothermale]|uniref:Tetratricopeptide repeat protein n=1 Tax=Thermotomaculum hydrothermale TaxID=981385 RepID=A0A7R6SYV1_9BACT|nr:tetratricopeptide repeat protein [Thermotomaculum hydrothermale]BBB33179.1 hypothetical protein TTHT_1705 [Thermotomaculum hydrothermale]